MRNKNRASLQLIAGNAFVVCLISLIWSALPVSGGNSQEKGQHANTLSQEQRARLSENFRHGRDLLLQKGLPFDPEELLDPQWQRNLRERLAQMPEMQETHVVFGGQMHGVHLADTLYLPEKVEVTDDTVILANRVIFEGRNAVIKGHHAVYFFPVNIEGVLGTSLDVAIREEGGPPFTTVSYETEAKTKLKAPPKWFVPHLLQQDWSLTINTNGKGWRLRGLNDCKWEDWLPR